MSWPPGACVQCGRSDQWVDVTSMGSAVTTLMCSNCGQQALVSAGSGGNTVYQATISSASNTTHPPPSPYHTGSSYTSSGGFVPYRPWSGSPQVASGAPVAAEPLAELPLAFDDKPLIGWRLWRVQPNWQTLAGEQRPRLCGIAQNELWPAGQAQNARCVRGTEHEAPNRQCACGNWAVRESSAQGLRYLAAGLPCCVVGRVAMWGHVLEFERGYRAQYAYPLDLQYVGAAAEPKGMLQQLCEDYNVPAANGFQTLPSAFWDQQPGIPVAPPPSGPPLAPPTAPRSPSTAAPKTHKGYYDAYTAHMWWAVANKTRGWFAT